MVYDRAERQQHHFQQAANMGDNGDGIKKEGLGFWAGALLEIEDRSQLASEVIES